VLIIISRIDYENPILWRHEDRAVRIHGALLGL